MLRTTGKVQKRKREWGPGRAAVRRPTQPADAIRLSNSGFREILALSSLQHSATGCRHLSVPPHIFPGGCLVGWLPTSHGGARVHTAICETASAGPHALPRQVGLLDLAGGPGRLTQ